MAAAGWQGASARYSDFRTSNDIGPGSGGWMLRHLRRGLLCGLLVVVASGSSSLGGCSGSGHSGPSLPPTLISIAVTPTNSTVSVGSNQQFTAQGIYSDGTWTDMSLSVTWSSSAQATASISSSGVAYASAIGRPQINATFNGVTGSTRLIVVEGAWVARFAYSVAGPAISTYT